MNKITLLTNNVILIGSTIEDDYGVIISKPHSIQNQGEQYQLTPFLENLTGQNIPEITIKHEHVIDSFVAENNEILQAYLEKISGIQTEDKKIII